MKGSITNFEHLKSAFADVDCVFHLAAIASVQESVDDPIRTNKVNLDGTLNVLIAARDAGVKRVIFASSSAVYGDDPQLPKKEIMVPRPLSPYAATKLGGEHYASVFQELYGLDATSLRFFNVFGPKQDPNSEYSGVISLFISAILNGRQPVIYGDGEQTRDFVYVVDVVQALILASRSPATGVFNVACGRSTSLNQLIEMIAKTAGRVVRPKHGDPRRGDIMHSLADIDKARQIGYAPQWSVEQGLKETLRWFESGNAKSWI